MKTMSCSVELALASYQWLAALAERALLPNVKSFLIPAQCSLSIKWLSSIGVLRNVVLNYFTETRVIQVRAKQCTKGNTYTNKKLIEWGKLGRTLVGPHFIIK